MNFIVIESDLSQPSDREYKKFKKKSRALEYCRIKNKEIVDAKGPFGQPLYYVMQCPVGGKTANASKRPNGEEYVD